MITSFEDWRAALERDCPGGVHTPARADFGHHYPWRAVALHAASRSFTARRQEAERRVRHALDVGADEGRIWMAAVSGKDSRAAILVAHYEGWDWPLMSVGDDCPYPGEEAQVEGFARSVELPLEWVRPASSTLEALRQVGLQGDLHSRTSPVARPAFYDPIGEFERRSDHDALMWGIRAGESRTREKHCHRRGAIYRTGSRLRFQPIWDWSAIDVHAMLACTDTPIPTPYLCVDAGASPFAIRTDWWFSGGKGWWGWVHRWWPDLYQLAAEIDPTVRALS